MVKVVLAGPPRSGKSCLREGLKQALRRIENAPYPYVITACPDGEGSWFQETVNADPERAAELKAAYKAKFTPAFVQRIADSVRNCSLPMVLVDIGGIPSVENEAICAGATHMVILAGDASKIPAWREFALKVGLTIVAEIDSVYNGTQDEVRGIEDQVLRGAVHHLERGEPVAERPTEKALAAHLLTML